VDIEDVVALRDAVKLKCPNALAHVDAADLTVFENRAKYHAKEALEEDSPIGSFGGSKNEALIVVVPDADDGDEGRSSCLFAHVPLLIDSVFGEGSHFIRLQAILSLIAAVLSAIIQIFGEDPGDEKGCLNTGAHIWVCYVIVIYIALTAMNAILDVWKTSCRARSKERTALLPLSKNLKKRMKKKRKRSKWWPFSWW
jgi:hypothetical protein